jgi:rhamnogalacturonan endolyase
MNSRFDLCSTTRIAKVFSGLVCAVLLLAANPARANLPGGFTPVVTAPVTTGSQPFGRRTDRYLDNGILHVLLATNGNVDSIKYLEPGRPGTPQANGVEMVSQFGISNPDFGEHAQIYFYWANGMPDGSRDCVYFSAVNTATNIDLGFRRVFNPAVHLVPADVELHYSLARGNAALYTYLVYDHPARYQIYTNLLPCPWMIWPVAHDTTNFLCEKVFIDRAVKTGLSLNGTPQTRDALEPNFYDFQHAVNLPSLPKEVYQMTSGLFSNQLTGKYSYNVDCYKFGAWGRASDKNKVGQWVVLGSHEYMDDGVTMCEYVQGDGLLYQVGSSGAHYGNRVMSVDNHADWTKIYGPWALYFNSGDSGDACWQDAKNQALAEARAWPYAWLARSAVYQPRSQRATVTGRLVIHDALRPGASSAGAWVGLAAPESAVENATNNWQFQSDGYQYWVRAAPDGSFTLSNLQTFSTYGGPATFQLYAFSAGTNRATGCVGEFSTGPFTFASGVTTNLGVLTWNVPHQGASIAWEIGYPDRTADKFRHGDDYVKPGLYLHFAAEFPNPLEYTVGVSDWSKDWNYAQCGYFQDGNWMEWPWRISFNLTNPPTAGDAALTLALAGAYQVSIAIHVNDEDKVLTRLVPALSGGNAVNRQGIHAKYDVEHVAIPMALLHNGANTITLVTRRPNAFSHVMYDYLSLELPPSRPPH